MLSNWQLDYLFATGQVSFGERSIDEMCQHYIWLRFERDAFLAARAQ